MWQPCIIYTDMGGSILGKGSKFYRVSVFVGRRNTNGQCMLLSWESFGVVVAVPNATLEIL